MNGSDLTAAESRFLELAIAGGVSAQREKVLRIDVNARAAWALRRLEERGHPNPSTDDIVSDMLSEYQYEVEGSP